jgi:hypothetical protein
MKVGRLILIAIMAMVAAAAAIAAIFYFKDEILERIAEVKKIVDEKKRRSSAITNTPITPIFNQ